MGGFNAGGFGTRPYGDRAFVGAGSKPARITKPPNRPLYRPHPSLPFTRSGNELPDAFDQSGFICLLRNYIHTQQIFSLFEQA